MYVYVRMCVFMTKKNNNVCVCPYVTYLTSYNIYTSIDKNIETRNF